MTPLQGSFDLSLVCSWFALGFCLGLCLVCVCLVASHNLQVILRIAELDGCLQHKRYLAEKSDTQGTRGNKCLK
jgi:hypothetical protein